MITPTRQCPQNNFLPCLALPSKQHLSMFSKLHHQVEFDEEELEMSANNTGTSASGQGGWVPQNSTS